MKIVTISTMVYYYTSENVKILRNTLLDYGAASDLSPFEYMKKYIEKCPENIETAKVNWITKTFLSIQKHGQFLKSISSHLSEELSEEDQDYFMIIFHAVIFQIRPQEMENLYKCLFNLSRPLLNTFTKFLGNNEVLTFISHVAQLNYDSKFITDKIIAPLFSWQPYISEMGHKYGEYVQKLESRKKKPKTIPIQPEVLNRKFKHTSSSPPRRSSLPATPPNSLLVKNKRKMLTKSAIDARLKHIHEKNKQKAANLLKDVKTADCHYAQVKSDNYFKKISSMRDEIENEYMKPLPKPRQTFVVKHNNPPPVKETAATLKRMNKRVQSVEQDEIQWLSDLLKSCKASGKVEELLENDRKEKEKERLYDIERKHLKGQISHEEALIAKKKVQEENKKRYEEILNIKESWYEKIEEWKKSELEKNKKQIEKFTLCELNLRQAKLDTVTKKKVLVEQLKKESEKLLEEAMKKKREELERRINFIKEIKILALIAKKAKVTKVIDLTETSGFGLLCEMSMAELQERLVAMKIALKEDLESRKKLIKEGNLAAKQDLEQTKDSVQKFMAERALLKTKNKKNEKKIDIYSSKEISDLKKILDERKKLRIQLTT